MDGLDLEGCSGWVKRLERRVRAEGLRDFGRGVRSQKVSGTKRKRMTNPNPAAMATMKNTHRHSFAWMIAALTSGIRFLPPRSNNVYMPTRKARSCRKKISAIVADGKHSTGLTDMP